jgi:hypothetical protein
MKEIGNVFEKRISFLQVLAHDRKIPENVNCDLLMTNSWNC